MAQVIRVGDTCTGTCQAGTPGHPRTFIGTWLSGSANIKADGIEVVRVGDMGITDCGHTIIAATGANYMTADGAKVHRQGDAVTLPAGGFGVSNAGSPSVTAL